MLNQEIYYDLCTTINGEFHPHARGWPTLAEAEEALARYRQRFPKRRTFIIEIAWTRVLHKKLSRVGSLAG